MMSKVRHTGMFLFNLFFFFPAWSQQTEFMVTPFDETAGLESNLVNAMLQDSRGYLWFGTADGLCRYDGYSFKTFRKIKEDSNSLPGNFVLKLIEDGEGKIWIGLLKDGISCYDPAKGIFKNYSVKNADSVTTMAMPVSMLFADSQNNIWAGLQQKGLIKLNRATGKFSRYNIVADTNTFYSKEFRGAYNSVYAMNQLSHDVYWLATHDGLYKFNASTLQMQPVRAQALVKNRLRDDLFLCLVADKNGLWLGSWAGGLSYYDFSLQRWSNFKFNIRNKNTATTNIIADIKPKGDNELSVASIDKGFGIFNKTTLRFTFLGDSASKNAIPGTGCALIMQDNQKNTWLSHPDGLLKIKQTEKNFVHMPVKVSRSDNGSFYTTSCMLEDKAGKYLFVGTNFADGLHIINRRTRKTHAISFATMPGEEGALIVSDLLEDSRGMIWVVTRDYIYRYHPELNKLTALPQPPPYLDGARSNFYKAILEDKKGKIWIASARNGIFCYSPSEKKYMHFYSDPQNKRSLTSNVVTALALDYKGRIWVGGPRGCFGYFDDSSYTFTNLDQYGKQSPHTTDFSVYTLYADRKGDILAGTVAGLYYYETHLAQPSLKNIYNADNGLKGDVITSVQEDSQGDIWCITSSAICKINRLTGNIIAIGKKDGIDNISYLNGFFLFQDKKMAAFTSAGYYIFDPLAFTKKYTVVPAVITSFKIDNKEQFFESNIASSEKVAVPANAHVISFEFAALDFDRPDEQQYTYRLQGFEKEWVRAGRRRNVSYANIPGGDYVFQLKATNTPDNWNVAIISMPLHINQPFYKSWFFLLLVFAAFALSLYIFYRFKLSKQQQILQLETKAQILEKEKALVMYESLKQQLNPHFLFNSLTSLSSLIRHDQNKAGDFLEGLSRIYRYILKSRHNETVTFLEEIKFVETFIKLQQTRFQHGLIANINVDKEFDDCKIAPVTLQNLIENAIKHNIVDEESPLVIDLYVEDNYIVIRNNLQRKSFVETSNKQGLANLTSLYRYLSTRPVIITENEEYFFVKIPMI